MKKRSYRMVAIGLIAGILSGSFTVYADDNVEKTKLLGMTWGSTATIEEYTKNFFEANPDLADKYEIEWVVGGEGDSDVAQSVRLALSSGEYVADFVQLNYTQVPEFAESGVLTDISDTVDAYAENIAEGALKLTNYKDDMVAFPFELKPRVWYYRSDIFEEAGIDVSQIKTTDDFIEAGKAVQKIYPDKYIWNLGSDVSPYSYYMTLSGNGAAFTDEDGNYVLTEDEGTRKTLEDYKKMVDSGVIMNVSDWSTDWQSALADGTLVSMLSASWMAQDSLLPTYAAGQEGLWACAQWPEIAGSTGGSDAGGSVFVIPEFSEHKDEAKELLGAMTLSEEGTLAIWDSIKSYPINTKAMESGKLQSENAFFGPSLVEAEKTAIENLNIFQYTPKAMAESDIVVPYFTKAVNGEISIDDALAMAQEDLEVQLGNAYD